MEVKHTEYDEIFNSAKKSTVIAHAMVWVKAALRDKQTDREQFEEIKKIVDEATKHLVKE